MPLGKDCDVSEESATGELADLWAPYSEFITSRSWDCKLVKPLGLLV